MPRRRLPRLPPKRPRPAPARLLIGAFVEESLRRGAESLGTRPLSDLVTRSVHYRHPITRRFISARAAVEIGGVPEVWEDLRRRDGRIRTSKPILTEAVIVKHTGPGDVEAREGLVMDAVGATNIYTVKDAKRVEFVITGRDRRGQRQRIQGSLDLSTEKQRGMQTRLMTYALLEALRQRNFRTNYALDAVEWRGKRTTRSQAKRRKVLDEVSIVITVKR